MIFGSGFVGLAIAFSLFVYMYTLGICYKGVRDVSILLRLFILLIIVANIKDFYYLSNSGITQILLILVALLLVSNNIKRKTKNGAALSMC
jgi:hypothetical protein